MTLTGFRISVLTFLAALTLAVGFSAAPASASTTLTAYKQAVAEAAARDEALAEFYKRRDYAPLWTSRSDAARRRAFLQALAKAEGHGLPTSRYDKDYLADLFRSARSQRDVGRVEVEASRLFLRYAQDIQTGVVDPAGIDKGIKRRPPRRDRLAQLEAFAKSSPKGYLKALVPSSPEYTRLMAEKLRLERLLGRGGWGPQVPGGKLEPGDSGPRVVALRDRLIAMGYMKRSAAQSYDVELQKAVQLFQSEHGLATDGVAGPATLQEINLPVEKRLQQVIVAMERERWLGPDRGKRHVLVNITDFHARIVENGRVVFKTRSVVGMNAYDRRTPEFSDVMEHMIINPTWNVPRSIAVKEYLPELQKDPYAVSHLRLIDARGRVVSRDGMDFTQYNARNFPFDMKQPPSRGNALGRVKFMFPNAQNVYMHDTPAKHLFAREVRAFSHGCIRLSDPFDFAYQLLAEQVSNPVAFFKSKLETGIETKVDLKNPLPVHIIYRTAISSPKGRMEYRRDVYGRDARIFEALSKAGVVLRAVQG